MSFTDDDLKRLKDVINAEINAFPYMNLPRLKDLLARLEAAEIYINESEGYIAGGREAYEAWRRAKGDVNGSEQAAGKDSDAEKQRKGLNNPNRSSGEAGKSSATPPVGPEVL